MVNFLNLKNYIDEIITRYNVPGADCIVYKEHEQVFRYFTGMSDVENNKAMNGTELYLIYSMTKMLTCVCALQLFEKGKYTMSDPLSKYLPEFEKMNISYDEFDTKSSSKITTGDVDKEDTKTQEDGYAENQITILDLFTMGAGLDYDLDDDAIKNALATGKTTTRELVGAMANKVLGFEPGTRFRYSLCHDVLGALVEVWSGEKFGEYMKNHIFNPLGMKNTFFQVPEDEKLFNKIAARYTYNELGNLIRTPIECRHNLTKNYESGGAGLVSCTEDYALFLDALSCGGMGKTGKRILSPLTVELMGINHLKGKQLDDFYDLRPGYGYGLGVRTHIDKTKSGSLSPIGEFGWDGAAGAFSMVDTKNKISLTYFQHVSRWDPKMHIELRNALYSCID